MSEAREAHQSGNMERKELLMVALIGVLLVTTAIQTVALVNLGGIGSGQAVAQGRSTSGGSAPGVSSGSGGAVASAGAGGGLADLPSMVGGC